MFLYLSESIPSQQCSKQRAYIYHATVEINKLLSINSPIKVRRLPDLLKSALRFQHHPAIPVWPRNHSKVGVFYPLFLKPFVMPKESLTKCDTSVHLKPHINIKVGSTLQSVNFIKWSRIQTDNIWNAKGALTTLCTCSLTLKIQTHSRPTFTYLSFLLKIFKTSTSTMKYVIRIWER